MKLLVTGLNHKSASVELRERVSFTEQELPDILKKLISIQEINELIILSTCNRTEFYIVTDEAEKVEKEVKLFINNTRSIDPDTLSAHMYTYTDRKAVEHVFRVASSLDSMVIGEAQILGQIKNAYKIASFNSTTGPILNRLMHRSFSIAKKVRTDTSIGFYSVSVSSVAVELAKKIFGLLSGKSIMLMGAGEMAEDAARYLRESGATELIVASRTFEHAAQLAEKLNGRAIEFEELYNQLLDLDIIICSTSADHYLITYDHMHKIMKGRQHKPLFFIDISVPRNIESSISDIEGVFLFDIDDLKGAANKNLKEREKASHEAETLIEEEVNKFINWIGELSLVPAIVSLKSKFEAVRQEELKEAITKLKNPSEKEIGIMDAMSRGIINKLLHDPIATIKNEHKKGEVLKYIDSIKRLFNI